MILGILGKKLGMTQLFNENGTVDAVTAVEVGPCTILQVKTSANDGYETVQIGFGAAKKVTKPLQGHMGDYGTFRYMREVPTEGVDDHSVGDAVTADIFEIGERIAVTGTSKGKGFAGTVKRHHFAGGPKTHGQKDRHRAPGSIGAGTTPGRVYKGTKMSGHMGSRKVTVRNVEVVSIDTERSLVLIRGAVPGATSGLLMLRKIVEGG